MFDCTVCSDTEKAFKGCYGQATRPKRIYNETYETCPKKIISEFTWRMLDLYQFYKAGFLYFSGGVADQPAIYLQSMIVIDSEIQKTIKEEQEFARRRASANNHSR